MGQWDLCVRDLSAPWAILLVYVSKDLPLKLPWYEQSLANKVYGIYIVNLDLAVGRVTPSRSLLE